MFISFICLSYNQNKEILRLLNTIRDTDNINYEIILIDDGSNDNTIYECLKLNINNIKIIQQYKNTKNQSKNRNLGIKLSKGSHTFFIDGDDLLLSNNFYELINYIEDKKLLDADVYFTNLQHQTVDNTVYNTTIVFRDDLELSHAPSQYIARRQYLIKHYIFFEETVYNYDSEDCFFFYLLIAKTNKYLFFNNHKPICRMIHSINNNTHSKFNNNLYSQYLYRICQDIKKILLDNNKNYLIVFITNYYYKEMVRIIQYKNLKKLPI